MKKFILKVFMIVIIFTMTDIIAQRLLMRLRPENFDSFVRGKKEFFTESNSFDVIIIGDSHIADALNPRVIENEIGLNTFNLAVYHSSPLENYYLLKSALENSKMPPKYIVLGTNPSMLTRPVSPGKYTPLIINDWLNDIMLHKTCNTTGFTTFSLFAREKFIIKGMLEQNNKESRKQSRNIDNIYHGYCKNTASIDKLGAFTFQKEEKQVQKMQIEYFKKMISLANSYDSKVLIAHPPIFPKYFALYKKDEVFIQFDKLILEMASKGNIEIFNKSHTLFDTKLNEKDFFDPEHINGKGAQVFSTEFSKWLKNEVEI